MLESQLEDFTSHDRLVHALLGLLSWAARIEALAETPRATPAPAATTPITDMFLGIVSVGRAVRASVGGPSGSKPSMSALIAPDRIGSDGILR